MHTLTEQIPDWQAQLQVHQAQRLVANVALTGCVSKNGYRYREAALREAVTLYEHKPVFLDHAADRAQPHLRSTRDLVGTIISPRFEAGRIRADIQTLDTESGRTFLALSDSNAPGIGMSHVVLAERPDEDGEVTRIHDVISVDAVVFPATTTTFRESQSVEDVASTACPAADETPLAELHRLRDDVRRLTTERDELQRRCDAHVAADREARAQSEVERLLCSTRLPAETITASFHRQLLEADDSTRRQLLQEHRALIERLRRQLPVSCDRADAADHSLDSRFVAIVRRLQ